MRTFIFTTALPPVNIQWTAWVLKHFADFWSKREHLLQISRKLKEALTEKGYNCPSVSHIVPMVVGASEDTIRKAEELPTARDSMPCRYARLQYPKGLPVSASH